jgi:ubiquinone/menaquinone biosynthesis C-methylase UbiE
MQMWGSFTAARILMAGVRLAVFSHLAAGPQTAAAVASAAGASERGTRMLLDALTGWGLLEKSEGRYRLPAVAARYLVRDSPEYMGAIMEDDSLWESWTRLEEAIRTGRPPRRVEEQSGAEAFFPTLIRSLHVTNREPARRAAQALGAGTTHRGLKVLDVACGSGVWGLAVAEADPEASVTFQDFPGVLEHTRRYVERAGAAGRADYLAGDLKRVDFGAGRFDVAILGNIVHSEGEASSRDLFGRLHRALRPGGRLAVIDMVPRDDRTGPVYPLEFALTMLVNTEHGDVYTLAEYRAWLTAAGFARVETADVGSHSPLIVAVREG